MTRPPILRKRRHTAFADATILAFVLSCPTCNSHTESNPTTQGPNVLLIVLDTVRADYLSIQGYPRPTTPRLAALAKESTVFRHAAATDFWTLPSHASLLTGLYPTEVGATSETNQLPDEAVTLAERLQKRGYATSGVVFNAWLSRERGFAQGFDAYHEMWRKESFPEGAKNTQDVERAGVSRIVAAMQAAAAANKPSFVFVNFNVAHMPYDPAPEFESKFASIDPPSPRTKMLREITGPWAHIAGKLKLDNADIQVMRDLYAAEVAMADDYVGAIVDALRRDGLLDNTVLIVTSDHGENIGEHNLLDHLLSMYETTLHVPMIIRYPKRFAAGKSDGSLVSLVDVVPTVLDCCNLLDKDAPPGAERLSLCREDRLRRGFVVAENDRPINGIELLKRRYPNFDTSKIDHRMRMIRTERYKLIWRDDKTMEVYDLEEDPQELQDIAAKRPEIRDQLHAQLQDWMKNIKAGTNTKMFESKDDESLRRLKALGYID